MIQNESKTEMYSVANCSFSLADELTNFCNQRYTNLELATLSTLQKSEQKLFSKRIGLPELIKCTCT